jgi:hypothetical protein
MAALRLTPTGLTVRFTRAEKIAGLLRDVEIPRAAIRSAEVVTDPLAGVRGLRAPAWRSPAAARSARGDARASGPSSVCERGSLPCESASREPGTTPCCSGRTMPSRSPAR